MKRAELAQISCPSCGAGLTILGGGRVLVQICGYCGTALDAIDNYKALQKFVNLTRPDSPLAIGMSGRILAVSWTIIGTLGLTETDAGRTWRWVDHLIYSPTHGYCWLTVEDGHLILTRRYRGACVPSWLHEAAVEAAENPPTVRANGETYRYYETSVSTVTFAEGEFTWRVAVDDRSSTISALAETAMLSFTDSGSEREVERSIYLPQAETWASFGVAPLHPWGVHPLQPFVGGPNAGFMLGLGAIGAAITLALSLVFMGMGGSVALPKKSVPAAELPVEITVPISHTRGLTTINLSADVSNAWAWMELALSDPEGQPVFAAGREVGYYFGRDSEGSWSEGSRSTQLRFHPKLAGDYMLELDAPEGGTGEEAGQPYWGTITVSVSDGGSSPLWTVLAALAFAVMAAIPLTGRILHHRARWHGTDWSD